MILLDSGEATSPKFLPPPSPSLGPMWAGTDALDRHVIDYVGLFRTDMSWTTLEARKMGCKTFPPLTEADPSVHLPPSSPASLLLPSPHCVAAT
jgi:hypothetical protein